jgi:hypothetical protein
MRQRTAMLLALAALLAGCGGSGGPHPAPTGSSRAAGTPSPAPAASTGTQLTPAAQQFLAAATEAADDDAVAGGTVRIAQAGQNHQAIRDALTADSSAQVRYIRSLAALPVPPGQRPLVDALQHDTETLGRQLDSAAAAPDIATAVRTYEAAFDAIPGVGEHENALRRALGLPGVNEAARPPHQLYADRRFTTPGRWEVQSTQVGRIMPLPPPDPGGYFLGANGPDATLVSAPVTPYQKSPSIEVEASLDAPKRADTQYGLSCPGSAGTAYFGYITAAGGYGIDYLDGGRVKYQLGNAPARSTPYVGKTTVLRLDCKVVRGGVVVSLYASGVKIGSTGSSMPFTPGQDPGLVLHTVGGDDAVVAREWNVYQLP